MVWRVGAGRVPDWERVKKREEVSLSSIPNVMFIRYF